MHAVAYLHKTFSFGSESLVGAILPEPKKAKAAGGAAAKKYKSRHVVLDTVKEGYVLVRKGIPIKNELVLEQLYADNEIEEAHFFIFKKRDDHLERNKTIPVWEACYFCTETSYYLRVQKCHLKQGYTNSGRTDKEKMWTFDPSSGGGLPYWVDRYIFCKSGQEKSKNKYNNKKND